MNDYAYFWQHPEEYPRIKAGDMRSNDAVVRLCEHILRHMRLECENMIRALKMTPRDEELKRKAHVLYRDLTSSVISSISFGGSDIVANEFASRCPEGVFDI